MKKLIYLLFATLFFISCEENEQFKQPTQDGPASSKLPEVIYATVADNDSDTVMTRTFVGGQSILWHKGDAIAYISPNTPRAKYQNEKEDGVTSAVFTQVETDDNTPDGAGMPEIPYAVYPYSSKAYYVSSVNALMVTFPTEQTYAANSFGRDASVMVAVGEDSEDIDFYFRNACGYLVLKLYGAGVSVKNIELTALGGEKIAGRGLITAGHGTAPTVNMTDDSFSSIVLNCGDGVALGADAANATEFWFALPATTFSNGIKIAATDIDGNVYIKQTKKTVNITRNDIQPMAALPFASNAPAANKLWYTRADGESTPIAFYNNEDNKNPFDATITKHYYDEEMKRFVIEFDAPLTTIKASAFRETALATIILPETVTTIEEEAFRETPLTEITIPGSVNTIGIDAFYDCEKLSSVTFNPSQTEASLKIGYTISSSNADGPFYYSPLTNINLDRDLVLTDDDGYPVIPNDWAEGMFANAYYDDDNYLNQGVSITLGDQVKTLSDYMFNWLPIQQLTIPGTVTTIGNDVFNGCSKLTSITFERGSQDLHIGFQDEDSDKGAFYDSPLTYIYLDRELIYDNNDLDTWDEGIFANSYYNDDDYLNQGLSVTLGDQVKTLSDYMFNWLPIQTLTIPGTVTTIGNNVFNGCTKLTSLTFEQGATALQIKGQDDADGPFYDSPLTTINYSRNFSYKKVNGEDFIPEDDSEGIFAISTDAKSVVTAQATAATVNIGSHIKTIPDRMFCNLPITALTIPGTVTTIGNNVFNGCTELTSLKFEGGITSTNLTLGYNTDNEEDGPFLDSPLTKVYLNRELIYTLESGDLDANEGIFYGKSLNEGVTLGDQVRTLSDYMFFNSDITSLTIPGTVTTIGNNVFDGCEKLTSLTFEPSSTNEALTLGCNIGSSSVDNDGPFYNTALTTLTLNRQINYPFVGGLVGFSNEGAFSVSGGSLKEITLGDQVTSLTRYMFAGAGIKSINLNKVTTIEEGAFCNTSIESISIPSTVVSVELNAFWGCKNLSTVNIQDGTNPLTFASQFYQDAYAPFYDSPLANIYLGREINYISYGLSSFYPGSWYVGFFATKEAVDNVNVTISDKVKTISNYMFSHLNLQSIIIPTSVTSIGNNAFANCDALASVTIPSTVATIGSSVFENCVGLTSATISSSTLGSNMFDGCNNLATVTIDGTLDAINVDAFTGCSKLSTLNISGSVGIIADGAFDGFNLTSLNISGHVGTIGANAFDDNDKMTSFTVTGSVGTIGVSAFEDSDMLATVDITGTVDKVCSYAFSDCDAITTLSIPANTVEAYAYEDMDGLTTATLYGATVGNHVFYDCNSLQTLIIDGSVISIGDYAFANCDALASVTIPSTVATIGSSVFENCVGLTSATISSSTLGSNMFDGCNNLATVTIDGTLDAINVDAFTGCSKLSTLNISGSVGSIGDGAFDGFNLTSLNISGHVGTIGANAFDDNEKLTSFIVTGSVGTIGVSAFEDSDMLATVDITGTVDKVCSYAFSDCDAITTLSIPANTVEDFAYEDMDGLKTARLYGTTVGSYVFYDCNSLQTLVIDGGVTKIGNNAFDQCYSLSSVTFESGSQDLHIGFQDESSDVGAFYDSPLTYIYLDRELVDDNDDLDTWDEGIFATPHYEDEDPVVTVTLGSNVKTISPWMFSCVRMENVEIPRSVTYIGKQAFSYCYILTEVSCRRITPPTLGEDVFLNDKDKYNNNLIIKVPYISGNEYREKWSQYEHKVWGTFVD